MKDLQSRLMDVLCRLNMTSVDVEALDRRGVHLMRIDLDFEDAAKLDTLLRAALNLVTVATKDGK